MVNTVYRGKFGLAIFDVRGQTEMHRNLQFVNQAKNLKIPLEYSESVGGNEWGLWDKQVKLFLKFMDEMATV